MIVTTVTITLDGVPDGAVIEEAYLYWAVYGGEGDDEITLDGSALTGALIGTAGHTCWPGYLGQNRVYRADVTDAITGNGEYVLTDLPTFVADVADGQGASVVVVYRDPTIADDGAVWLLDGAAVVSAEHPVMSATFGDVVVAGATAAALHLGVGDGQQLFLDGQLIFDEQTLPAEDGLQHFAERDGTFWDVNSYDVLSRLPDGRADILLQQAFEGDCLVFAYAALVVELPHEAVPDAGTADGGAAIMDGGVMDAALVDTGTSDAARADAAMTGDVPGAVTSAGCGCRARSDRAATPWLFVVMLALVARRVRLR